jgi:Ca2+/Na+ antiporter
MERVVKLIFWYVGFMIVGDFLAYLLGLFTELEWGEQVSLIVFLLLYFLFLWVSWMLAVRVTQPQEAP